MSVVTVGCEPEQTDRAEGSGERRKVAHNPPSGGISNSWGNSLLVRRSSASSATVSLAGLGHARTTKAPGCAAGRKRGNRQYHHGHLACVRACVRTCARERRLKGPMGHATVGTAAVVAVRVPVRVAWCLGGQVGGEGSHGLMSVLDQTEFTTIGQQTPCL